MRVFLSLSVLREKQQKGRGELHASTPPADFIPYEQRTDTSPQSISLLQSKHLPHVLLASSDHQAVLLPSKPHPTRISSQSPAFHTLIDRHEPSGSSSVVKPNNEERTVSSLSLSLLPSPPSPHSTHVSSIPRLIQIMQQPNMFLHNLLRFPIDLVRLVRERGRD